MSSKTRSIAEALKAVPTKRASAAQNNAPTEALPSKAEETRHDQSIAEEDGYELPDVHDEPEAAYHQEDRYDEGTAEEPQHERGDSRTAPAEDLISRLTRLHGSGRPQTDYDYSQLEPEEETHRATSRQRQRRAYEAPMRKRVPPAQAAPRPSARYQEEHVEDDYSDGEYQERPRVRPAPVPPARPSARPARPPVPASDWDDQDRHAPRRQTEAPYRTSRRSTSRRPATDHADYYPPARSPPKRTYNYAAESGDGGRPTAGARAIVGSSRGRRPATPRPPPTRRVAPQRAPAAAPHETRQRPAQDEARWEQSAPAPRRGAGRLTLEEDYFDDRNEAPSRQEPSDDQVEAAEPVESADQGRDGTAFPFTSLSKTAVTKAAKVVGVSSMAADVHETVKDLSGQFLYKVLSEAAQSGEVVSSAELEPIVEKRLGRPVEDLDQSFINANTFVKWLRGMTDELQLRMRNEAVLFLQQVLDFWLVELLSNARDVAEQAGRSRVMVKDLLLATRMR